MSKNTGTPPARGSTFFASMLLWFPTVVVEGMEYYLPIKPRKHASPSTKTVPIDLLVPETPNDGVPKNVLMSALAGKDLIPLDRHGPARPTSDPYIKLFFKEEVVITEVQEKTVEPLFETGRMDLGLLDPNDTQVIEIQYWDYDRVTNDDFGGAARISIAGLLAATKGHSGLVFTSVTSFVSCTACRSSVGQAASKRPSAPLEEENHRRDSHRDQCEMSCCVIQNAAQFMYDMEMATTFLVYLLIHQKFRKYSSKSRQSKSTMCRT